MKSKFDVLLKYVLQTRHDTDDRWDPQRHPVKIHHGKNASQDDFTAGKSLFDERSSQS
jgi:hypothetical protein